MITIIEREPEEPQGEWRDLLELFRDWFFDRRELTEEEQDELDDLFMNLRNIPH